MCKLLSLYTALVGCPFAIGWLHTHSFAPIRELKKSRCLCTTTSVAGYTFSRQSQRFRSAHQNLPGTSAFLSDTKLWLAKKTAPASESRGGFGKNASSENNNNKDTTLPKLKPKQQWDRYLSDDLTKNSEPVRVAVRTQNDWLDVGHVRTEGNQFTALAVVRQRALLAEHARRLYPLQISPQDKISWAYWQGNEWILVDPKDAEYQSGAHDKKFGFAGLPDPKSGYYCVYNEGRLVRNANDQPQQRPSSKKLS